MTTPGLYKGKKSPPAPVPNNQWVKWIPLWTIAGGLAASLTAAHFHQRDLGWGLGWGGVFASVNFFSLKLLTEKVLTRTSGDAKKYFWIWNSVRWAFLAFGCWMFLRISPACLGGAALSYVWFLLVLGWMGWRSASQIPDQTQR